MTHASEHRLDWVDAAKGICIILVVMMHATFGVEKAVGGETWLHTFINWARPFRMPDFFLISGLFLASRIDRPWRSYLDTKVLHFAYFYALWFTILYVVKGPWIGSDTTALDVARGYLTGYIEPYGSLWFIYLLAVFFVVAKLVDGAPKLLVLAAGALVHAAAPETGWTVVDEFTDRFVFFYSGYAAAPYVMAFAAWAARQPVAYIAAALAMWACGNWVAVQSGIALMHGPDLPFSYAGIAAVIAVSVLMASTSAGRVLAYCGQKSIVVYLAFPLFMGPVRSLLLKLGAEPAAELVALASTLGGVAGPLLLNRIVRGTRFAFLFVRPKAFKMPAVERRTETVPAKARAA